MNPLLTTKQETFRAGTDKLEFFRERLLKMNNGALMFCTRGEANITIDLRKYHIVPNTHITLLPSSIISLTSASKDFLVDFFAYSETMFKTACFRLEPPFIHFIKENACYTHTEDEPVRAITGLITASNAIYRDSENLYREAIAQNLLQIFFLDTYDKVQRYFTEEQINGSNRKEELFKKFIIWFIRTVLPSGMSFFMLTNSAFRPATYLPSPNKWRKILPKKSLTKT